MKYGFQLIIDQPTGKESLRCEKTAKLKKLTMGNWAF